MERLETDVAVTKTAIRRRKRLAHCSTFNFFRLVLAARLLLLLFLQPLPGTAQHFHDGQGKTAAKRGSTHHKLPNIQLQRIANRDWRDQRRRVEIKKEEEWRYCTHTHTHTTKRGFSDSCFFLVFSFWAEPSPTCVFLFSQTSLENVIIKRKNTQTLSPPGGSLLSLSPVYSVSGLVYPPLPLSLSPVHNYIIMYSYFWSNKRKKCYPPIRKENKR